MSILFVVMLFFSLCTSAKAIGKEKEKINLLSDTEKIIIDSTLFLLEDKQKKWTIEEVVSGQISKEFTRNGKGIPNFGYTSSAYWAHFEIDNQSFQEDWLLEISYPPLNQITLYYFNDDGELEERKMGGIYPFDKRDVQHRNFVYELEIESNTSVDYYLRVETEGAMQLPLTIWQPKAFIHKTQYEFIFLGIFYGMMLAMVLYNLFLYFSLRHISYLFYVFVIVCSILANFSLNGMSFQYIWSYSPWWNIRSIVFFVITGSIFSLMFARSFLDINYHLPKFNKVYHILIGFNCLVIVLLFFSYSGALNLMVLSITFMFIVIITSTYLCLRKGVRQARYFFLAWVVFLVGVLISALADSAFFPLNSITKYAAQIAGSFEVILLSFALADRINIMRKEKERAERELTTLNRLLEHKVSERTIALEITNMNLETVNDELKEMEKSRAQLLSSISHELGTPITLIQSYIQAVREGLIEENNSRYLDMIYNKLLVLDRLTRDLFELSKLRTGKMNLFFQHVVLEDWLEHILQGLEADIKQSGRQFIRPTPYYGEGKEQLLVNVDIERMDQVFSNLSWNAVKHTSPRRW